MKLDRDFKETSVSMVSGLIINYSLTILMFDETPEYILGATTVFFVCSFIRSYVIRKIFRKGEVT